MLRSLPFLRYQIGLGLENSYRQNLGPIHPRTRYSWYVASLAVRTAGWEKLMQSRDQHGRWWGWKWCPTRYWDTIEVVIQGRSFKFQGLPLSKSSINRTIVSKETRTYVGIFTDEIDHDLLSVVAQSIENNTYCDSRGIDRAGLD